MVSDLKLVARDAFGTTPDTRFLYMSHSHRQALDSLFHGIEGDRPFVVLTGEPGTGKTTLLFHLLEHYLKSAQTVFIFQSQCSPRELMHYVLADCDIPCGGDDVPQMHEQFNQLLISTYRTGKRFLLLLDEAQNFPQDTLEAVRLLSDFETPNKKLLQIVFSGQPSFDRVLASPAMLQLRQRISVYCPLEPLTREETNGYIAHRLNVIGRSEELFSRTALQMIFDLTRGIPREVHNVCFDSLCLAGSRHAVRVDSQTVRESARRLRVHVPEESYTEPEEAYTEPEESYSEPEKSCTEQEWVPATAAAASASTPLQQSATAPPAASSFDDSIPVVHERMGASLPPAPLELNLYKPKEPQVDADMDRFRYLFEPAKDRPVKKDSKAEPHIARKHTATAVLAGGCAVILIALALFAGKGDIPSLKSKLISVVEARVESAKPELQPPVSAVDAPQQASPVAKPKSKPDRKQVLTARSTPVPEIAANGAGQYPVASVDKSEAAKGAPDNLSRVILPGQAGQSVPIVEPVTTARLDAPPPPAKSEIVRSKLLESPSPAYPEEARRAGVYGVVELDAVIDTRGRLKDIRVVKGHPLLIRESIKAAERQQYTPFLLNSVPQEVPTKVRFVFKP
jgi:TonB family protein